MVESFGFIHDKTDIKILILFILRRLPEPVDFETLTELVMCDDGINYFDFSESVAELAGTGHLTSDGMKYAITEKGDRDGRIIENDIPHSVRMKAEKSTSAVRKALSRSAMISASHVIHRGGGYTVGLSLSDGIGEVISLELFAANETQATALEEGFRRNAEAIYNRLLADILSDQTAPPEK